MEYITSGTLSPAIPKDLIKKEEKAFLEAFGFEFFKVKKGDKSFNLEAENYNANPVSEQSTRRIGDVFLGGKDAQLTEEQHLFPVLQQIIKRSDGRIKIFCFEAAYTAEFEYVEKLRGAIMPPGSHGGCAYFITRDSVDTLYTNTWLENKKAELINEYKLSLRRKPRPVGKDGM